MTEKNRAPDTAKFQPVNAETARFADPERKGEVVQALVLAVITGIVLGNFAKSLTQMQSVSSEEATLTAHLLFQTLFLIGTSSAFLGSCLFCLCACWRLYHRSSLIACIDTEGDLVVATELDVDYASDRRQRYWIPRREKNTFSCGCYMVVRTDIKRCFGKAMRVDAIGTIYNEEHEPLAWVTHLSTGKLGRLAFREVGTDEGRELTSSATSQAAQLEEVIRRALATINTGRTLRELTECSIESQLRVAANTSPHCQGATG